MKNITHILYICIYTLCYTRRKWIGPDVSMMKSCPTALPQESKGCLSLTATLSESLAASSGMAFEHGLKPRKTSLSRLYERLRRSKHLKRQHASSLRKQKKNWALPGPQGSPKALKRAVLEPKHGKIDVLSPFLGPLGPSRAPSAVAPLPPPGPAPDAHAPHAERKLRNGE